LSDSDVTRDDWFRNKTWNTEKEEAFFEKLGRARSQRDQYLAIQAITLAPHHPRVAIKLVDHYFETRKDDFHDVQALLANVDAHKALNDRATVVRTYKEILAREVEFPKHKTTAYVMFPYLVATKKIEDEYAFAIEVLDNRQGDVVFPLDRFMWHASYALISSRRGDDSAAKKHAQLATAAAEARKSGFRYHQNLGLVGKEHKPVVKELIRLAIE
jgi:hypothetical protein